MKNYRIGEMLRNYRKNHSLTIKQLAKKTGLSTALISELERGIGNPTLSVLETLADIMGISLAMLLERDISNASLVRRKIERTQCGAAGANALYDVLAVSPVRSNMELLLMELEPGRHMPDEMSVHPAFEEIAYVISGQTHVHFDQEEIVLEEGDSLRILPGRRHLFENKSESRAIVLFAQDKNL